MRAFIFLVLCFVAVGCTTVNKLPKDQYYEFVYRFDRDVSKDSVYFHLKNPLQCPVNVKVVHDSLNLAIDELFGHITLRALQDTVVVIAYPNFKQSVKTRYVVRYGDLERQIVKNAIAYPFPKGKSYKIIQGYEGKFTHSDLYSRYAIDFNLLVGDTICSADKGFIVGLIQDYKDHGTTKEWLTHDKSNYLTIYHPHSGLYTQYVHLDHQGAVVKLGDWVEQGQPIGIAGMTGFTTTPHLHFNVKIPTANNGLISTKIEFLSGIKGEDLKRNMRVK